MNKITSCLNFLIMNNGLNKNKSNFNFEKVFTSFLVSLILIKYGFDNDIVSASLLEFVNNDNYDLYDISKIFGGKISSIIITNYKYEESISWEENKKHLLKILNGLPTANKAVFAAQKIIELTKLKTNKNETESLIKLKYYYKEIYDVLIEDNNNKKLNLLLNKYLDLFNDVFANNEEFKLPKINSSYIEELSKLKLAISNDEPFIIRLTSNNCTKNNIYDLFKSFMNNNTLKLKLFSENTLFNDKGISKYEESLLLAAAINGSVLEDIIGDNEIILCSDYLFIFFTFINVLLESKMISQSKLNNLFKEYEDLFDETINYSNIIYNYQVVKENISTLDTKDLSNYFSLLNDFNTLVFKNLFKINKKQQDIILSNMLLPILRKEYILKLKKDLVNK